MEFLQSGKFRSDLDLIALTGTSGGAVCASLVWSALHRAKGNRTDTDLTSDEAAAAVDALQDFWRDLAARDPLDVAVNLWGQWVTHLPVTWEVSPYVFDCGAAAQLRDLLTEHVRLEALSSFDQSANPVLYVGVTDAKNGQGWAITGEGVEYDDIIASAAVPPLFKAVHTRNTFCWDGLFSRNPPIRELTNLSPPPEEIWIIQINPRVCLHEPMTIAKIIDRRNQLSGNLALNQEMKFIDTINQLIEDLRKSYPEVRLNYQTIVLRTISLDLSLDYPSKFDRSAEFIEFLIKHGKDKGRDFLVAPEKARWTRDRAAAYQSVVRSPFSC